MSIKASLEQSPHINQNWHLDGLLLISQMTDRAVGAWSSALIIIAVEAQDGRWWIAQVSVAGIDYEWWTSHSDENRNS